MSITGETAGSESTHNEEVELLVARARTYRMGAAALAGPPPPSLLAMLRSHAVASALSDAYGSHVGDLLAAFGASETDQEVARDYSAVFLVPSSERVVLTENYHREPIPKPQEYTEGRGRRKRPRQRKTQGLTTIAVAQLYARAGFVMKQASMADHLSVEMEFMALCCDKLGEALRQENPNETRRWRETVREFIIEHLALWATVLEGAQLRVGTSGLRAILLIVRATILDHLSDVSSSCSCACSS